MIASVRSIRALAMSAALGCLLTALSSQIQADIVFPSKSGITNVVELGVDNTGQTDVTDTLQNIFQSENQARVIYFPKGTYLVSGMLRGITVPRGTTCRGAIFVGESRTETVIRLKDNTWPTPNYDPTTDKPGRTTAIDQIVLNTGDCTNTTFESSLKNMTINTGSGNAGAIGVVFTASNSGMMSNVDIVSEDGTGNVGLALTGKENGPGHVRNVRVDGFSYGCVAGASVVMSMNSIVLENSTTAGFYNRWRTFVDSMVIRTDGAPAIQTHNNSQFLLVNGWLSGGDGSTPAIEERNAGFYRNITASGFSKAIQVFSGGSEPAPSGNTIDEYATHGTYGKWFSPGTSMNLPIKYPPYQEWDPDTSNWASLEQFQNTGFGFQKSGDELWNEALATGKPNLVIPFGKSYELGDTLRINGHIERLVGTTGSLSGTTILIEDGTADVITVELVQAPIVVRTGRTVILERAYKNIYLEGTGEVYINDLLGELRVRNPEQKVWIRKFNEEYHDGFRINSGQVWILGYKSEGVNINGIVRSGGICEVLGFLNYEVGQNEPYHGGMFEINDGHLSLASFTQVLHNATANNLWVKETRGSESRNFTTPQGQTGGALYTGFDPASIPGTAAKKGNTRPGGAVPGIQIRTLGNYRVGYTLDHASSVKVNLLDTKGRLVGSFRSSGMVSAGNHFADFSGPLPSGTLLAEIITDNGVHTGKVTNIQSVQ